jgi:hypothetical protein
MTFFKKKKDKSTNWCCETYTSILYSLPNYHIACFCSPILDFSNHFAHSTPKKSEFFYIFVAFPQKIKTKIHLVIHGQGEVEGVFIFTFWKLLLNYWIFVLLPMQQSAFHSFLKTFIKRL